MSTLEKLFIQIFDRKNWIIDQLKQQSDLYDQYLASTLLINGIRPPSWLWSEGFDAGSAKLKELKKEELISGLLFPPPRPNIASTIGRSTLYNRPVVTTNDGLLSDDFFTETCTSNKYFDVGDRLTVIPKFNDRELDLGCPLKGVPELDHVITSPRDQIDARMSDASFEPDHSLSRIQRSRSRQKALENRNSAKVKSKKRPRKEDCANAYTGRTTRSRTSSEQPNQVTQSRFATQVIMQSSRSGEKDLELCNFVEANAEKHPSKEDTTDECSGRITRSVTTHLHINCAEELFEQDNSPKLRSGRVTRSRSASINRSSQLEKPLNCIEDNDLLKAFVVQGTTVLCNDVCDIFPQEGCMARIAESGLVSKIQVEACSIHSQSNMVGASLGARMDFLVSRHPSDNSTFVEPKQLVFDDVEDCSLNQTFSPALEEEKQDGPPEMRATSFEPTESLRKLTINEQLLKKDQTIETVHRKERWTASSEDHEEERHDSVSTNKSEHDFCSTSTGKTSNSSALSSRKGPSETYVVADTSPGSNKISKQAFTESLKKVTISSDLHEKCGLFLYEQLLKKDQIMEVANRKEELKDFSGVHGEDKLEYFQTDRLECEKSGLSVDVELLERDKMMEVLDSEEEGRASYKAHEVERLIFVEKEKSECIFHPVLSAGKFSNVSPLSSRRGPSEIYEDVEADTYPESNKITKKAIAPADHSTALQVVRKSSLASQLQGEVDINFPDVGKDTPKDCFVENFTTTLDVVPNKMLPEDYRLDIDARDGPKKPTRLDFNHVTGFSLEKPETSSIAQETESSYIVASDASKRSVLRQTSTPNTAQMHNTRRKAPYSLRSYTNLDKNAGGSKSNGSCFENNSIPSANTLNNAWQNSWPQYKRRKIDGRSSNVFTTSPGLITDKHLRRIHEDATRRYFKSAEDGLGVVQEFQHSPISCDVEVAHLNVIEDPSVEMRLNEKHHKTERFGSSPKLQVKQGELDIEGVDQDASLPIDFLENSLNYRVNKEAHGDSQGCLKDKMEMAYSTSIELDLKGQFASEDDQNLLCPELNLGSTKQMGSTEGTMQKRKSNLRERSFSYCSVGSPHYGDHGLIGADQTMPVFEGFHIGLPTENILSSIAGDKISFDESNLPSTTSERISVLEQLCRSTSMLTPLPHPSKYKLHTTPDIYQSLPNGLLEHMDTRNSIFFNDDDTKQLKANSNTMGVEVDNTFLRRSYSNFIPSSSWDVGNPPYTPPVRNNCQRITSISAGHSSDKQQSVNPGLTCFRIDEDTGSSEENGSLDEAVDPFQEGITPRKTCNSTKREPLVDITNINPPASVSVTKKFHDRGSLNSVNTELNFHGTQMGDRQQHENGYGNDRRYKNKNKEIQSSLIGGSCISKDTESLHNRFSRPKLSRKASEKKGSQSFLDKERTNIISNISSFIPLVQQKHQPPAGKREIKVKALETAEAAKRLEEKKENDRKMKKKAAKLERARLEQEKVRQLELQQKKKEEERKKKEIEMAARKRLREEDRKEKERKRKCIEEARRHQKEQEEKLRAEKEREVRCRTVDERESKRKELYDEERKHQRTEKGRERAESNKKMATDTRTAGVSAGDARKASDVRDFSADFKGSHDIEKEVISLGKANDGGGLVTEGSQEPSYEISPYQGSDDEEEEDEIHNTKFIPSWAREKYLDLILPSMQQIDPCEKFPPASFCSIDEVLLPRKNPK